MLSIHERRSDRSVHSCTLSSVPSCLMKWETAMIRGGSGEVTRTIWFKRERCG